MIVPARLVADGTTHDRTIGYRHLVVMAGADGEETIDREEQHQARRAEQPQRFSKGDTFRLGGGQVELHASHRTAGPPGDLPGAHPALGQVQPVEPPSLAHDRLID